MRRIATLLILTLAAGAGFIQSVRAEAIIEAADASISLAPTTPVHHLVRVAGVADFSLQATGVVVGLDKSGDKNPEALERLVVFMRNNGYVNVTRASLNVGSVALVTVQATLPAFPRRGDKVDVTVQAMSGAKSLKGGRLLATPLKSPTTADPKLRSIVYAWASGDVEVGTMETSGTVNRGGVVAKDVSVNFIHNHSFILNLKQADAGLARDIVETINQTPWDTTDTREVAYVTSPKTVRVEIPSGAHRRKPFQFYAEIMSLPVAYERPGRVVINRKDNSVVIVGRVRVTPVVILFKGKSWQIGPTHMLSPDSLKKLRDNPPGSVLRFGSADLTLSQLTSDLDKVLKPEDVAAMVRLLAKPSVDAIRAKIIED